MVLQGKTKALEPVSAGFKYHLCLLSAVWPQANYFTSWSLEFTWEMVLIELFSKVIWEKVKDPGWYLAQIGYFVVNISPLSTVCSLLCTLEPLFFVLIQGCVFHGKGWRLDLDFVLTPEDLWVLLWLLFCSRGKKKKSACSLVCFSSKKWNSAKILGTEFRLTGFCLRGFAVSPLNGLFQVSCLGKYFTVSLLNRLTTVFSLGS